MSRRDENTFKVKPGAPRTRDRQFLSRVLTEVSKAGSRSEERRVGKECRL